MIPAILKRTVTIDGHKTSVTLEDEFWYGLREIARGKNATLRSLITQIDDARKRNNLSSAIRVFVLNHFRRRAHSVDAQIYKVTSSSDLSLFFREPQTKRKDPISYSNS